MGRLPVRSRISSPGHGQFDAFEDGAACVDAHRDAVAAEGDRLAFIKKTVDRHAFFFQLLDHQAHGFGRDVGVGKVVLQMQLVPGEHLLQGSTKTPAQLPDPKGSELRRRRITWRVVRCSSTQSTMTLPKASQNC